MSNARRFTTDLLAALALASRQFVSGCVTDAAQAAPEVSTGSAAAAERCEARLAKRERAALTAHGACSFCDGETLVSIEAGSVVSLEIPPQPVPVAPKRAPAPHEPARPGDEPHAFAQR